MIWLARLPRLRRVDVPLSFDFRFWIIYARHPLWRRSGNVHGKIVDKTLNLIVTGDEVRLTVDLQQHTYLPTLMHIRVNQSFVGLAAGLLVRRCHSLGTKKLQRGVTVSARLLKRLLAVHHARPGLVPELFHILGTNTHIYSCIGDSSPPASTSPTSPAFSLDSSSVVDSSWGETVSASPETSTSGSASAAPPRFTSSFANSRSMEICSLVGRRSSDPSPFNRRSSCSLFMRSWMVEKFVSNPPSQRCDT